MTSFASCEPLHPVETESTPGSPSRACLPTSYQVTANFALLSPGADSWPPTPVRVGVQAKPSKATNGRILFLTTFPTATTGFGLLSCRRATSLSPYLTDVEKTPLPSVPAYRVEPVVSMAKEETPAMLRPVFIGLQFAPPSSVLKTPLRRVAK